MLKKYNFAKSVSKIKKKENSFGLKDIFLHKYLGDYALEETRKQTMNTITHERCPLCKGSDIKKRFSCKDHFATGEEFGICECHACGFVFTQNVPDEKEIGRYYESQDYISHSNTKKGFFNKVYHIVRTIMLHRKVNLIEKLTLLKNGKVLDYGAGTGYFARAMAKEGWEVTAIEKSPQARELSLKEFKFEMLPEEYLSKIGNKEFDVVTLWHVMEHIQELDMFWDELYRIIDDTGIAVIALPNCKSYDAMKYKENWAAYDVPRHLWHFTPNTIMRWGEKHGFILERQITMPFDGFYISMLSERYKGSRTASIRGIWNGLMGWLATSTHREASSSIIYVFRKKR